MILIPITSPNKPFTPLPYPALFHLPAKNTFYRLLFRLQFMLLSHFNWEMLTITCMYLAGKCMYARWESYNAHLNKYYTYVRYI